MQWYYAVGKKKVGPLEKAGIEKLAKEGIITPETLVWTEGIEGWLPYQKVNSSLSITTETSEGAVINADGGVDIQNQQLVCSECGGSFPSGDTVKYGESTICASCKSAFFQKIKEGRRTSSDMIFGGVLGRFGAKFLDNLITGLTSYAVILPLGFLAQDNPSNIGTASILIMVIQFAIPITYVTWFIGKYQATPGKMAAGLIIVSPDGGRISYLKAFARYFAEILSGILLGIGYLMAAFDEEKRTLHDRICATRVIKK